MPPTTPRVDISLDIVTTAKWAICLRQGKGIPISEKELEKIPFSATLATAAESYKDKIVGLLDQAGFREHPPLKASEKRPRRVDLELWEELGKTAKKQGIARMELVRALLVLLGDEFKKSLEIDVTPIDPNSAELAAALEQDRKREHRRCAAKRRRAAKTTPPNGADGK